MFLLLDLHVEGLISQRNMNDTFFACSSMLFCYCRTVLMHHHHDACNDDNLKVVDDFQGNRFSNVELDSPRSLVTIVVVTFKCLSSPCESYMFLSSSLVVV